VNGCVNSDTVRVNVNNLPGVSAGADTSMCPGMPVVINAVDGGAGVSYNWNPTVGLSSSIILNPTADPSSTTTYTLTVTAANGCLGSDTVIVNVSPIIITPTVTQPSTCDFVSDGAISIVASGGSGSFTYSWTPGGSSASAITNLGAGDYKVVVEDAAGCKDSIVVELISTTPVIADAGRDTIICEGNSVILDGSLSSSSVTYQWFALPNTTTPVATTVNFTVSPLDTTSYMLVVANLACQDEDTIRIAVNKIPTADAGEDISIISNTIISLGGNPTGSSGTSILWSPTTGLDNATSANPQLIATETTTFSVTVTNAAGCSATDTIIITVVPQVTLTTGLTPNGDGMNDFWIIGNIDQFPDALVEIYNRWGEVLYSSVGYKTPWDGKYKDTALPVGTYYYIIDLRDERFPQALTGPLTIIR